MTNGTSQGLFVVVAIVIFGIFVGLSYTVFGDTLKPALADLFTNATEQTVADLNKENVYPDATSSELFDFIENETSITITKYTGTFTDVVIPKEIEGKPVTVIGKNAFYSGTYEPSNPISVKLTSVIIPNTVTSIGEAAFAYNSLTSVELPDYVNEIGMSAFFRNSLTSVDIPNNLTIIRSSTFYDNKLTSVTIGNSVTIIDSDAFTKNQLTSVIIPDSVTEIGQWAFYTNSLTSVTIGNSVTTLSYAAFANNKLTNVLIPDSVTTIGGGVFSNNLLTSVLIPDSVKTIGASAFTTNIALKTVELPYGFVRISTLNEFQAGAVVTNRTE